MESMPTRAGRRRVRVGWRRVRVGWRRVRAAPSALPARSALPAASVRAVPTWVLAVLRPARAVTRTGTAPGRASPPARTRVATARGYAAGRTHRAATRTAGSRTAPPIPEVPIPEVPIPEVPIPEVPTLG